MKFEIEAGGRSRVVEIDGRVARIDGRALSLDVAKTGRAWSLLLDGRSFEVFVVEQPGVVVVHVNGLPVPTVVAGRQRGPGRLHASSERAQGPKHVTTPMPGRIVKVLVKAGDSVLARQALIVVEAMKMENELRSPKAGTVSDVRVIEGMSVEANALLVVVD